MFGLNIYYILNLLVQSYLYIKKNIYLFLKNYFTHNRVMFIKKQQNIVNTKFLSKFQYRRNYGKSPFVIFKKDINCQGAHTRNLCFYVHFVPPWVSSTLSRPIHLLSRLASHGICHPHSCVTGLCSQPPQTSCLLPKYIY